MTFLRHFGRLSGRIMIFAIALLTLNFSAFADNECPITVATYANLPDPNSIADGDCARVHVEDTNSDYILDTVGKKWTKFLLNVNIPSDSLTFNFDMYASGVFTVDCGDDGSLASATGVSGKTITRSNTTGTRYTCNYTTGGNKTITMDGAATGYNASSSIRFYSGANDTARNTNVAKITGIAGSLGQIFGTVNNVSPGFYAAFRNAINLTSIPNTLFSGITTASTHMFYYTFEGSGLTSVPAGLFSNITTGTADGLFLYTFENCKSLTTVPSDLFASSTNPRDALTNMFSGTFEGSGLTSVPAGLFSNITGTADNLFRRTFYNCKSLKTVPADLFASSNNKRDASNNMFEETFAYSGLTSVPAGLFSNITETAEQLFRYTFRGCKSLTTVSSDLFASSTNPRDASNNMFYYTFEGSGLTSVPAGLFSNITGTADNLFRSTFQNCTSLTSVPGDLFGTRTAGKSMFMSTFASSGLTSVPSTLFNGISGEVKSGMFSSTFKNISALTSVTYPDGSTTNYLPYNFFGNLNVTSDYVSGAMTDMFTDSNAEFSTSCPSPGTAPYNTVYDSELNGKVLCQPATYTINYDCNNGNANTNSSQSVDYNSMFTANICTYPGHTFQSYSCLDANKQAFDLPNNNIQWKTILTDGAVINCTANWGNTVYTINFKDADGNALNVNGATSTTWTFGDNDFVLPDENDVLQNNSGKLFNAWFSGGYNGTTISGTRFGETISSDYIVSHANNKTLNIYAQLYKQADFVMTTVPMNSGDEFGFYIYEVDGTFYIDWGDQIIEKISGRTGSSFIGHTYTSSNSNGWKVGLSSENVKGYTDTKFVSDGESWYKTGPTTFFLYNVYTNTTKNTKEKLAKIEGNLSAVFPTILKEDGTLEQPVFFEAFRECTNLKGPIPSNLFANIYGQPRDGMFAYLFTSCSKLGTDDNGNPAYGIPENLFGNLYGEPTWALFQSTFNGCSGLKGTIPEDLFGDLSGEPAYSMFQATFSGCSNLIGQIPQHLFCSDPDDPTKCINGAPAPYMFTSTFYNCSNLTGPIPDHLFGNLYGAPAKRMFSNTFDSCSKLDGDIPQHLFCSDPDDPTKCINGAPADWMYNRTFADTKVTGTIPKHFFGNISGPVKAVSFNSPFYNTNLKGPIPDGLFENVTGAASGGFRRLFAGTDVGHDINGNVTPVPADLFKKLSGEIPAYTSMNDTPPMFHETFKNSGITKFKMDDGTTVSYVPPTFFGSLTRNSHTTDVLMNMFEGDTQIAESCTVPGTYKYTEGLYGILPNDKVSCEICPSGYTSNTDDNDTIYRCYNANANCLPVDSYGGEFVSGHLYYAGEGVPDSTDECIYNYTVTLEGTEGVQASLALTTYNKNSTERTLPTADIMRKPGAIFAGWLDANDLPVTEIPADARGPVTYTAQWTACPDGSYCPGDNTSVSCVSATNNNDYIYSDGEQASINDCYRVETQSCASIVNYSISNGSVVYANETAQCKYYYGSNKCDLINESACNIENVNCSTGYNPGSTGQLVGVNVSNMSSGAVCPLGRTADDEDIDIAAMCSTLQSGWGYLEFNESSIGFERINGRVMCNSLNPYENIGFVASLSELAELNPEMSQDDIIASIEHSSGMYCWAIVTDVDGTPLNNAPYVYWGSYDDAETCYTDCAWFAAHDNDMNRFLNGIIESMDELACVPQVHTISLIDDNNSKTIYTVYDSGVYSNENLFDSITNNNALYDIPTKPGYIFAGYYSQQSDGTQYIDKDGYLTEQGRDAALGYIDDTYVWYAQWTACPADSFCPGDNTSVSCATEIDNEDYKYSDGDHASVNDCYRDCVAGIDVPNATAVSGSVHYSANGEIKSCVPVNANSCATGYEYQPEYVKPDNPSVHASGHSYLSKDGTRSEGDISSLEAGEWIVYWDEGDVIGSLKGVTSCNDVSGVRYETTVPGNTFDGTETGQYCWCKPTEWNGKSVHGEWVLRHDDIDPCSANCTLACVAGVEIYPVFRDTMYNSMSESSSASCSLKTYTITYNDGESDNTVEYTVENEKLLLKDLIADPTKDGYTFDGWYTTADYQAGTEITSIDINNPDNLMLYAHWTSILYTITYDLNGGEWIDTEPESTYSIENHIALPNANKVHRTDYSFVGWCLENANCDSVITSTSQLETPGNVTLYAKWAFGCPSEKYLHIGDSRMCLSESRGNGSVFVVMIDGRKYYALLSPAEEKLPISKCSNTHLHIMVDDVDYTVHDNSASTQIQNCQ